MQYFKYQQIVENGPDGRTLRVVFGEDTETKEKVGTELATVDGVTYISLPDGKTLPEQHEELVIEPIELTEELREAIKRSSSFCRMVSEQCIAKIREHYSIDDEAYFSRIGVGAALGVYTFQSGEREQLLAFGEFVESVRQWGREQRKLVGL